MASLVTASKGWDLVARPLKFLREDLPRRVHLCPIDEFDVCGPAPRRHQPIGRGSSVFVREDHRIAELPALAACTTTSHHISTGRSVNRPTVLGRAYTNGARLCASVASSCAGITSTSTREIRGWPADGEDRASIRLDDQMMRSGRDRADCDAVVAVLCTARQEQMLRILAVYRDSYRGRLAILFPPVASCTRRMHDRHGLTVGWYCQRTVRSGPTHPDHGRR